MIKPSRFDAALSYKLDQVILQLDAQPRGLRWLWLRLRKRWLERSVPSFPNHG